jgi:hypothetical protein
MSQEHGYHIKDPKESNAGGCMHEIKRATKHGDGGLDTPESTPHNRERHLSYLGSGPSWLKPLRPAFLYCTAKPREAYKVLIT